MLKHTLLAMTLFTAFNAAHAVDEADMRKRLSDLMPGTQIGAITLSPRAGLYEVIANGHKVFYTNEQADIAFIGKVIDLKSKIDLAEARSQELQHVDFATLPLEKAIIKIKGDGSRKLAVFSDPDCPFCQELEQELNQLDNISIYTFLYPIASLHPDAERKARLVWCAKDRAQAWDELMLKGKEPAASDAPCSAPLQEINVFAKKNWIGGTPGLVFPDGRLIPGMIKAYQVERFLAASQSQAQK